MHKVSNQQLQSLRKISVVAGASAAAIKVSVVSGANTVLPGQSTAASSAISSESGTFLLAMVNTSANSQASLVVTPTGPTSGAFAHIIAQTGTVAGSTTLVACSPGTGGPVTLTVSGATSGAVWDCYVIAGNDTVFAGTLTNP